jgi:hypothetical protein
MKLNQNKPFPELMAIFAWLHEEIEADGSSGKVSSRLERAEEKKGRRRDPPTSSVNVDLCGPLRVLSANGAIPLLFRCSISADE